MNSRRAFIFIVGLIFPAAAAYSQSADVSRHTIQFVTVQENVKLEVLDWGGSGKPIIFLAGLGNTAHDFDSFAPRLTGKYHVYGITRRGFGESSKPEPLPKNYGPDRRGDDILAVITALGLTKPVLAGHSQAGEEMTSIGLRHPDRISGLVYLDAGYEYAAYSSKFADGSTRYGVEIERNTLRRDLERLSSAPPAQARQIIAEMQEIMPRFTKLLNSYAPQDEVAARAANPQVWPYIDAIDLSSQKYTESIDVPILALFAIPKKCTQNCDGAGAKIWAAQQAASADAFEAVNPRARVVRLANAGHAIWKSNEADVLREMNLFLDGLPKPH